MSRKDALLRLHKSLVAKRDELREQLTHELDSVQGADAGSGDLFDAAMDGSQNEMHSQLAAFESRELQQIERAIKLTSVAYRRDSRFEIIRERGVDAATDADENAFWDDVRDRLEACRKKPR